MQSIGTASAAKSAMEIAIAKRGLTAQEGDAMSLGALRISSSMRNLPKITYSPHAEPTASAVYHLGDGR
jgi:hypothetical protein